MQERATVTISDRLQDCYGLYIPSGATPENMAAIFTAVCQGDLRPGLLAADLVGAMSPKKRVEFFKSCHEAEMLRKSDWAYFIRGYTGTGGATMTTCCVVDGKKQALPVFDGKISDFPGWVSKRSRFDQYRYKVVEFAYSAGSRPGEKRMVRVEDVGNDGSRVVLSGYDLTKPGQLKRSFRNYFTDRISGEIRIVA